MASDNQPKNWRIDNRPKQAIERDALEVIAKIDLYITEVVPNIILSFKYEDQTVTVEINDNFPNMLVDLFKISHAVAKCTRDLVLNKK